MILLMICLFESYFRSLPSWTALQIGKAPRNSGHADTETYEDSPEEIKQRSAKETEILTGNLGDAIIPAHEILADPAQLRILALLHESMVSFFFLFLFFFQFMSILSMVLEV